MMADDEFARMQLNARKLHVYVPVSDDSLNPNPLSWRKRVRWAFADWRLRMRERVGFWIAGYTPNDD